MVAVAVVPSTGVARGTEAVAAELVELGPEDLPAIAALLGEAPAARWVGVRLGERVVGVAGWVPTDRGVRLIGPRVDAAYAHEGYEEALIMAVEELAAEDCTAAFPIVEAPDALRLRALGYRVVAERGRGGSAPDRPASLSVGGQAHPQSITEPPKGSGQADPQLTTEPLIGSDQVGFESRPDSRLSDSVTLERRLPELVVVPTAEAMQALGEHLAELLRAGDLVILNGDLGAGKTTLTQGIGAGLGVAEPVTSPTFVLSRIHPGAPGQPDLVHVDAYRLAASDEVDDIDLDHDLESSVTVIEWGAGLAEQLAEHRLEIDIRRGADPSDQGRLVILRPIGARWDRIRLRPENGDGR